EVAGEVATQAFGRRVACGGEVGGGAVVARAGVVVPPPCAPERDGARPVGQSVGGDDRSVPGQEFVEEDAELVDVARRCDLLAAELLGARVLRREEPEPRSRPWRSAG